MASGVEAVGEHEDVRGSGRRSTLAPLVERDRELAVLDRVLDDLSSGISAAVRVRGEPGVGRSALLRHAAERAKRLGLTVLHASGSIFEADLSFGVVSQLLDGQAMAEAPVPEDLLSARHGPTPDLLHRLRASLFALARRAPTLLVVDDLQSVDHASQRWLQGVRRRLHEVPLVVVTASTETHRTPADDGHTVHSAADHLLRLRPLSRDGAREILGERAAGALGDGPASYIGEAALGNPAVLRGAEERFTRAERAESSVPLPACIVDARAEQVTRLLDGLPEATVTLLRAIVVCGDSFEFDVLCSVAQLRVESPSIVLDRLRRCGLVTSEDPPRTVGPVVDARVLAAMSGRERGKLYARAALMGHRAAIPDGQLARLLLGAEPVGAPWAVEVLRNAAETALAEGRYESARCLLIRAQREPMSSDVRVRLLVELAAAEVRTAPEASDRLLTEVFASSDHGVFGMRVRAADLMLARGNSALTHRVVAGVNRSGTRTGDSNGLAVLYWMAADSQGETPEWESWSLPELSDDPIDPDQAGVVAWRLSLRGQDSRRVRKLARTAVAPSSRDGRPLMPRIAACKALMLADEMSAADAGLHAVLLEARRSGEPTVTAVALFTRAELLLRTGRLDEAGRDLSTVLDVMPLRCWHPLARPALVAMDIVLHIERGLLDVAERAAAVDLPAESVEGIWWSHLLFARGVLLLNADRPKSAWEHFQECGRRLQNRQQNNPGVLPWRSLAATALGACGSELAASHLVSEELDLAQAWGVPTTVGIAQLGAHRVLGGAQDASHAAMVLRESPSRLRYAEALVHLAESRTATGEQGAGELLKEASELAVEGGAHELVRRIAALLEQQPVSLRARVAGGKELSEAETRIVGMVVRGLANPEIARTLSISRRAVEMHLTNVYRKWGIAGRRELASAFARIVDGM